MFAMSVEMSEKTKKVSRLTLSGVRVAPTVLLLSIAALLASSEQTQAGTFSLTTKWAVHLGPINSSAIYRLAPCSDGDLYLSDATGRLVLLNQNGAVISDTQAHKELGGAAAIACDSGGNLIAAAENLVVLSRNDSNVSLATKISIPKGTPYPHHLALVGNGTFYFTGTRDGKAFIHEMDLHGNLLRSFGASPSLSQAYLSRLAGVRGSLVWDSVQLRLLYIPSNPFEIRIYDQGGTLIGVKQQAAAALSPPRVDPQSGAPLPSDEVMGAAMVPGNRLVVQILKGQPTPTGGYHRIPYLYVFDSDLNKIAVIRQPEKSGVFQGAASDGTLYFAWITRNTGIQVLAQTLTALP